MKAKLGEIETSGAEISGPDRQVSPVARRRGCAREETALRSPYTMGNCTVLTSEFPSGTYR